MKTASKIWQLIGGLLVSCACSLPTAATSYVLTDVGDPGIAGYDAPLSPVINESGQVAYTLANSFSDYFAYFYSGGALTRIPTLSVGGGLPGHDNDALELNDSGYVVGSSRINNSTALINAYVSLGAGAPVNIHPYADDESSIAYDINNSGLVLGNLAVGGPGPSAPYFLYSIPAGTTTNLTPLLPVGASALYLNDLGHVLGESGGTYFYYDGVVNVLPVVSGDVSGFNNLGQMSVTSGNTAYLYSSGVQSLLGSLGSTTWTESLNDHATVVGTYDSDIAVGALPDTELRAWISYAGGGLVDLNTLIDPSLGWTLLTASDVNNRGQITGVAFTAEGFYRPYILTPIPEPSTYAFFGAGLLVLLAVRSRCRARRSV